MRLLLPFLLLLAGCALPAAEAIPLYISSAGVGVAAAGVGVAAYGTCRQQNGCKDVPVPP